MSKSLIDTIVERISSDLMDRVEHDGCLHKSSIEDVCRKVLGVEMPTVDMTPKVQFPLLKNPPGHWFRWFVDDVEADKRKAELRAKADVATQKAIRDIGAPVNWMAPRVPLPADPNVQISDALKHIDKIKADMQTEVVKSGDVHWTWTPGTTETE